MVEPRTVLKNCEHSTGDRGRPACTHSVRFKTGRGSERVGEGPSQGGPGGSAGLL